MDKYTPEQVERAAEHLRVQCFDELEVERMLTAYAATLRQQAARVDEDAVDRVAKAIADAVGHGMREKCEPLAHAAIAALAQNTQGEAVAYITHSADKLSRLDMTEAGLLLGVGKHALHAERARVPDERLVRLVEKWRIDAFDESDMQRGDISQGVERCLEELEAALAQNTQGEAVLTDERIEEIVRRNGGKWDGDRWIIEDADLHPIARTLHAERARVPDVDAMVSRFLGWRLPADFAPDGGVSFNPPANPLLWPTGTCLLNDPQASAMFKYVLATAPAQNTQGEVPQEWRSLLASLAAVVRVQNGNRHDDTNRLISHADRLLAAAPSQPKDAGEVGHGLCQRNPAPNAAAAVGMTSATHMVYVSGNLSATTQPEDTE